MSSEKAESKATGINLGRAGGIYHEKDVAKAGGLGAGLGTGIANAGLGTGLVGAQAGTGFATATTGLATAGTGVIGQQYAQQSTVLVSNEPMTVVATEQRLASNRPVLTEKHISKEYVPIIHEEIVTTVPIVTGEAVHTGIAIGGERYVQPIKQEWVHQQAATKIDLMPSVQTQLGPQEVVTVGINQPAQLVGKTVVIPSQTALQQETLQQTTTTTTGLAGTGFLGQPGLVQQTGVIGAQPVGVTEVIQTQAQPGLLNAGFAQPGFVGTGAQAFNQPLGTNALGNQFVGQQPLMGQPGFNQGFANQGLGTGIGQGLANTAIRDAERLAGQGSSQGSGLVGTAIRDAERLAGVGNQNLSTPLTGNQNINRPIL